MICALVSFLTSLFSFSLLEKHKITSAILALFGLIIAGFFLKITLPVFEDLNIAVISFGIAFVANICALILVFIKK